MQVYTTGVVNAFPSGKVPMQINKSMTVFLSIEFCGVCGSRTMNHPFISTVSLLFVYSLYLCFYASTRKHGLWCIPTQQPSVFLFMLIDHIIDLYNHRSNQGDIFAADWPRGGLHDIWVMTCLQLPQPCTVHVTHTPQGIRKLIWVLRLKAWNRACIVSMRGITPRCFWDSSSHTNV